MMLTIGVVVASTPTPAVALTSVPATPSAASTPARPHVESPSPSVVMARDAASSPRWKVERSDSLWKIAEATLGDGERSGEILEINPWLGSPRHLKAGQV